mmetsp:Transcript_19175/g.53268  ORF Transcript_19175/g.53268 Transcript_19175/m.53268 type:complete len:228 (-) Transcript_19175:305-988(-)
MSLSSACPVCRNRLAIFRSPEPVTMFLASFASLKASGPGMDLIADFVRSPSSFLAALGTESNSSVWPTHMFSKASCDFGKQMPPESAEEDTGTARCNSATFSNAWESFSASTFWRPSDSATFSIAEAGMAMYWQVSDETPWYASSTMVVNLEMRSSGIARTALVALSTTLVKRSGFNFFAMTLETLVENEAVLVLSKACSKGYVASLASMMAFWSAPDTVGSRAVAA